MTPPSSPPNAEPFDDLDEALLLARAREKLLGLPNSGAHVGRYRIIDRLGAGGMGVVYSAYDDELDRAVALKILRSDVAGSDDRRRRLVREAQAMARLSHSNVVHVYEIGHHEDSIFIAMELVRGVNLRQWLAAEPRSWSEILAMFLGAAQGLVAAHAAGLVHRDFKPDNVLVGHDGIPRVLDFGLARSHHESIESEPVIASPLPEGDLTVTGTVMGTPLYMAPEQIRGEKADHRADQFAFCVALFEALYGHRPFVGSTLAALAESMHQHRPRPARRNGPRRIAAVLRRGLSLSPDDRFPSMSALIGVAAPLLHRRRRVGSSMIGLGVVGAVGLAAWMSADAPPTPPSTIASADAAPESGDRWASVLAASDLPQTLPTPLPDDPAQVTIHRLANGLTIYVAHRVGQASVRTRLVVRADELDEAPDEVGAALVLQWLDGGKYLGSVDVEAERESLVRRDAALDAVATAEDRTAAIAAAVEADRKASRWRVPSDHGSLAHELGLGTPPTGIDAGTQFARTIPVHRLRQWAQIEADLRTHHAFRSFIGIVEYLVADQRAAAADAARTALHRELGELTGHPFDPEATAANLRTMPLSAIRRYWGTHFRPNNTAIVLVGDVKPDEAVSMLEPLFAHWEPSPRPDASPKAAPAGPLRRVRQVVDDGTPRVVVAWPAPSRGREALAFERLRDVIESSRLGPGWFEADGRARWLEPAKDARYLEIAVEPRPGHDHADAEAAVFEFLEAIAGGRIAQWDAALGRVELDALAWADDHGALADHIADSFALRIEWADYVARMRDEPIPTDVVRDGARRLLGEAVVVVHHVPGPPAAVAIEPLELPKGDVQAGSYPSPFSRSILDQDITDIEPQFLVPRRDFEIRDIGGATLVAVPSTGPTFHLDWIVGVGVRDDPFVCDAWRGAIASSATLWDDLRVRVRARCEAARTTIEVTGIERRFEAAWAALSALLTAPTVDDDALARHVTRTLELRSTVRGDEVRRGMALHMIALRGEEGVDQHMPDDATLRAASPDAFRAALATSLKSAPIVLYAGSHVDELASTIELVSALPASPMTPVRPRALERTTVFAMDDSTRVRTDVLRTTAVPIDDSRAALMSAFAWGSTAAKVEFVPTGPHLEWSMPIPSIIDNHGLVTNLGIECDPADAVAAVAALTRAQQSMTCDAERWRAGRLVVEQAFRSTRRFGVERARDIGRWLSMGRRTDPNVDAWLEFESITDAALDEYLRTVVQSPSVVSVVGDLDQIGDDALAQFGPVVVLRPTAIRDIEMTDLRLFGMSPEPP